MALIETLEQLREAYSAIAGSADRADQAADRMEQHEQRAAALVDRMEQYEQRAAARDSRGKWGRILDGAFAGLIAGLLILVALAVFGVLPPGPSTDQERLEALADDLRPLRRRERPSLSASAAQERAEGPETTVSPSNAENGPSLGRSGPR